MRDVRGEKTWKSQEVWCQGGEAEKGVKPAVEDGRVGKVEVDGGWDGAIQLLEINKVGQEVSQARKTRGKFGDKTEVRRYVDESLCGVGCNLERVEGHKTLSG